MKGRAEKWTPEAPERRAIKERGQSAQSEQSSEQPIRLGEAFEISIMLQLAEHNGVSIPELARLTAVDSHNISRVAFIRRIEGLEKEGVIERREGLWITPKGQQFITYLHKMFGRPIETVDAADFLEPLLDPARFDESKNLRQTGEGREDRQQTADVPPGTMPNAPQDLNALASKLGLTYKEAAAKLTAATPGRKVSKNDRLSRARRVVRSFDRQKRKNPDLTASPEVVEARRFVNAHNRPPKAAKIG